MPDKNNLIYKKSVIYSLKRIFKSFVSVLILIHLFSSCQIREEQKVNLDTEIEDLGKMSGSINEMVKSGKSIFYGLYSPTELTKVFENVGAEYTPPVLNSIENASNYLTSSKIALNLGVYGVDLGYLQLFHLSQESVIYWTVIEKLTNQLGIPGDIINASRESLDENFNNADSLEQIATVTFAIVKNHLKEQDRESAAAMIIIGGWVEALYIVTEALYNEEDPDPEIIAIIAEQKYSLNSLVSFAKNYHQDPEVAIYYRKLRLLQNYFREFDIYYEKNDLRIDTVNKVIITSGNKIDITKENILQIKKLIRKIREEIVN